MLTRRRALQLSLGWLATPLVAPTSFAQADTVELLETVKPGDRFACQLDLTFRGKMIVDNDGKPTSIPIEAKATHHYVEQLHSQDANGSKVLRQYSQAVGELATGVERSKRELPANRRTIVMARTTDSTTHYHPEQPLTRDELSVVAEHFDTLSLGGLLPGQAVAPGETWPIRPEALQAACLFDGLIKHDCVGKLLDATAETANFEIRGTAEGIEHGAMVKLTITAKGAYSRTQRCVTALTWEQTDDRQQGPISPKIQATATIQIRRTPTREASPSPAAGTFPPDGKIPELLTQLRLADVRGRYELLHHRDWHIVVQSEKHLVLRLLSRGELIAQATLAEWKPTTAGDYQSCVAEFVEATRKQPGWVPEKVLENGPVPVGPGRELYRLSASGTQDGLAVVQTFHLLSPANGPHLAITIQSPAAVASKVGTRDVALVTAIEFASRK